MRIFILFLVLNFCLASPAFALEQNYYQNKINQLKTLNIELRQKLILAIDEIDKLKKENISLKNSNPDIEELEKTRKELENKTYEIKQLREKMMVAVDEKYSSEN
jgi:hypothetical protein